MCRNPSNGKEFKPSRRVSETTGQRSVSAFRVAFLSVQVTKRQARSKRAGNVSHLAHRKGVAASDGRIATDDRRDGGLPPAHVPWPHSGADRTGGAQSVWGIVKAVAISPLRSQGIGRFTHCAAIRSRLSEWSCNRRRARDGRSSSVVWLATSTRSLHRDLNGIGTESHASMREAASSSPHTTRRRCRPWSLSSQPAR